MPLDEIKQHVKEALNESLDINEFSLAIKKLNNGHFKEKWYKTLAVVIGPLLAIGAVLLYVSSWRTTVEITQTSLQSDIIKVDAKVDTHCLIAKKECDKMWDRFDTDKDDRQIIKDNVRDMKNSIANIETSQTRTEKNINEIRQAIK